MMEHVDVVIVGAGLSGIGAASHLKRDCPEKCFVILESRSAAAGTWDLFRYPGIRSDSDMYTLGYSFRPWTNPKSIADGESIRDYINDTIDDEGLASHLRLNHRVISAEWSTKTALWTVAARRTASSEYPTGDGTSPAVDSDRSEVVTFTCSFLSVCSGYYRYDEGFTPTIPGSASFTGEIVHPQQWPAELDYTGKRVVVIGSGATAVTLVPSMAKTAGHVTMLQRSPTYIAPLPSRDRTADKLRGKIPAQLAYNILRVKKIAYSTFSFQLSRRRPETMKAMLRNSAVQKLPAGFDVDTHLTPSYEPWDQRLCVIPDGDLYRAISSGSAEIVTDHIERITPTGIDLVSGASVDADVIVTATGLNLLIMGGMSLTVDGQPVDVSRTLTYKGMMLAGVPNFSLTIGYTNASWTLKADMVARYVGRLLKYMDRHHYQFVTPQVPDDVAAGELVPLIDLQAGYVLRGVDMLPKQGARSPWRLYQNYVRDFRLLRTGAISDDVQFGRVGEEPLSLPGTATITVDGTGIRYRSTGVGRPVLMIHGIGQSLEDFTEQHELLSTRHRVVSLDLPGFGYSQRLSGPATLAKLAGILPAFLDALGITDPVPVVGNSLGGAIAMTFTTEHPKRVESLVLADSAGFGPEVTTALRLLTVKPIARVLMRPKATSSARTVQALFYDKSLATDERIAHSLALSRRQSHTRTTADIARDLGTIRGVRPEWRRSVLAALRKSDTPTLVLWGDHDHVLPSSHMEAAIEALPHAETHVFAKTGHMPQIERPEEFATLVTDFVSRHSPPAAPG